MTTDQQYEAADKKKSHWFIVSEIRGLRLFDPGWRLRPASFRLRLLMSTAWLADTDDTTAWAHRTWKDFAALGHPEQTVVILPVYGLGEPESGLPLDCEEAQGAPLLRAAVRLASSRFRLLVLPPLRFVVGGEEAPVPLALDAETAQEQLFLLAKGIRSAGFRKLVFFNTSQRNEAFLAAAAIDLRAELNLQTYIIHGKALERETGASTLGGTEAQANALCGLLEEIRRHRAPAPTLEEQTPAPSAAPGGGVFPSYRNDYFLRFSLSELRELAARRPSVEMVLPTAAIEQHGPHLPVGVDAILGQALLKEALQGKEERFSALILPPIVYGKSIEHASYPGTLSVNGRVLRRQVLQIARSIKKLGFTKLRLFNTHGGNTAVLDYTARELREELRMEAGLLRYDFEPQLDPQERAWGMHADEWETSLMLAAAPELVRMDKAVCEYPARLEDPGLLRPEKAAATFAWLTSDVSASGVLGNAPAASAEKGRKWLALAGASIAKSLECA